MSLSVGLDVARSSLAVAGEQISVISRNISRIDDANATRKIAQVATGPGTTVHVGRITRASNPVLLEKLLTSTSDMLAREEMAAALDALGETVGDTALERSPAAFIASLEASLQQLLSAPQNSSTAIAAVNVARQVALSLNEGSNAADILRRQADADISASVDHVRSLLSQFGELNTTIVRGTLRGADVSDALDTRDGLLKALAEEIGITTLTRADGDLAIFTESGITLFDKVPRQLNFQQTPLLGSGLQGSAVYADGVPVLGGGHVLSANSGRLAGKIAVRDDIVPAYQRQLDEIARGLIAAFSETDQSAVPTLPPAAGLFTHPGGPSVPAAIHQSGLAGSISINASVDPDAGGNPMLLRDGGIAGAAYTYNATGAASYTLRIEGLMTQMNAIQTFDAGTALSQPASIATFARGSVGWLQQMRQDATSEAEFRVILHSRLQSSFTQDAGVSLDEEMAKMLELERTFQASSRLISAVDAMLQALLAATR